MKPKGRPLSFPRAASRANRLAAARRQDGPQRLLVTALIGWVVLAAFPSPCAAPLGAPTKKLIEYGWDVPTPAQMREELGVMEKRPFDGLIFRLNAGHNAFLTKPLEPAKFTEDERILRGLQFTRFRDNFILIWGSPPAGFDWFDEVSGVPSKATPDCWLGWRRQDAFGVSASTPNPMT